MKLGFSCRSSCKNGIYTLFSSESPKDQLFVITSYHIISSALLYDMNYSNLQKLLNKARQDSSPRSILTQNHASYYELHGKVLLMVSVPNVTGLSFTWAQNLQLEYSPIM